MTFNKTEISGVGIGLRHQHFKNFIEDKPNVPWLEIHTENYFSPGSTASKYALEIRETYAFSCHSVGLSLGSAEINLPAWNQHLTKIKATIERFQPTLVSDHLSWSADADGNYLPDLLPVPYTQEALEIMVRNVSHVQEFLGKQILVENPSSYLSYKHANYTEWEFLNELAKKSGCGLLLDINNIHVSAHNHGFNADEFINTVKPEFVQEIHLAGYESREVEGKQIFIDTHSRKVYPEVWDLYEKAVKIFEDVPALIEWDSDIPELSVLLEEKSKADVILLKNSSQEAA